MAILIKNEKMPKVKIIIGNDNIFKIGLIREFAKAITKPIRSKLKRLLGNLI